MIYLHMNLTHLIDSSFTADVSDLNGPLTALRSPEIMIGCNLQRMYDMCANDMAIPTQ